jgi:hypothetical protein
MGTISKVATLVAGIHLAALATPAAAFAQEAPTPGVTARLPVESPGAAGGVIVHIEGSTVAELQRDSGDHRHWDPVCTAPCDQAVSPAFTYRIGGDGIRNSKPFSLHGERETLNVDEGSTSGLVFGIVGVSVGGASVLIGCLVLLVNGIVRDIDGSTSQNSEAEGVGIGMVGIGLAAVVAGAYAIGTNARTHVTQGTPPASPSAWLPTPQDTRRDAAWARPPMVGIPLFGGHF